MGVGFLTCERGSGIKHRFSLGIRFEFGEDKEFACTYKKIKSLVNDSLVLCFELLAI